MLEASDKKKYWRIIKYGPAPTGFGLAPMKIDGYIEQWRKKYNGFSSLPPMTQEAIAVLAMCEPNEKIGGIGRRISKSTYWLDDKPELLNEYDEEKNHE